MKKSNYIWIVVKKEVKDILRDRKTLLINLLLPLVLYPVMFLFMGNAMTGAIDKAENSTVVGLINLDAFRDFLESRHVTVSDAQSPLDELKNGKLDVVLKGTDAGDGKTGIEIIYDDSKSDSTYSADYVASLVRDYNELEVRAALRDKGIDLDAMYPVSMNMVTLNIATGEEDKGSAGMILSMILPMMLVIFLAMGGMATAADLFAGEKERKTMEPLLCTRAGRSSILAGKYIVVTIFSLVTLLSSALGMVLGYVINPRAMNMGVGDMNGGFVIPAGTLLLTLLLVAVMAMIFAGLHVAISTYARTIKEASTYGTFLMLIGYVPAFGSMMMQAGDFSGWMMFVPLLNVIGCIKMVLGGVTDYAFMLGSLAVSAVFLLLVLGFSTRLFRKEAIMLRTM